MSPRPATGENDKLQVRPFRDAEAQVVVRKGHGVTGRRVAHALVPTDQQRPLPDHLDQHPAGTPLLACHLFAGLDKRPAGAATLEARFHGEHAEVRLALSCALHMTTAKELAVLQGEDDR